MGADSPRLDTDLTDELIAEGSAREFVNRIQNMRKEAGFAVTDRIAVYVRGPEKLMAMLRQRQAYIQAEILAEEFSYTLKPGEYTSTLDIDGEQVEVGIERRRRR